MTKEQIIEAIKNMTVREALELVKDIKRDLLHQQDVVDWNIVDWPIWTQKDYDESEEVGDVRLGHDASTGEWVDLSERSKDG